MKALSRSAILSLLAAAHVGVLPALSPAVAKDDDEDDAVVRRTPYQVADAAPASAWRPLDMENTLLMDLPSGEVVIELRPDIAPKHIEQVKALVRQGFYDGLKFHRVIEGFMAQGGDPKGDGTGGSDLPNLDPEFVHEATSIADFKPIGRDRIAARVGFVDGMPAAAEPAALASFRADRRVLLWPAHCPGVLSMARATDPRSANSQFFLMIGDARANLDQRYSAWGWIVDGFENTRRISRGEPPTRPTPVVRMRIASDVPAAERPNVEVMRTSSEAFAEFVEAGSYVTDGLVKDLCNVKAPRRVNGKVEL